MTNKEFFIISFKKVYNEKINFDNPEHLTKIKYLTALLGFLGYYIENYGFSYSYSANYICSLSCAEDIRELKTTSDEEYEKALNLDLSDGFKETLKELKELLKSPNEEMYSSENWVKIIATLWHVISWNEDLNKETLRIVRELF